MKKKALSILLSALLLISTVSISAVAASVDQFIDVKPKDWYYEAVKYAVTNGLFDGTSTTTFSPNQSMSRGMFVTVLGRKSGVNKSQYPGSKFSDVSASKYYAPYINWAAENDIVGGTGNGKFSPDASITREQIAKILYGYAQKTGNDSSFTSSKYSAYPDTSSVSSYAVEPLQWATTHGIINGSDGKLKPNGVATRAQVAKIFMGAEGTLVKTEIVETPKPEGVYGIGDTWTVDGQWALTVTGVEETQERNQFSDKKPAAVYIVTYTYKNLGYESEVWDGLALSLSGTGSIVDNAGYMGYEYPGSITYYPQDTPIGATCIAQSCIGVDHAGDFTVLFSTYDGNIKKQKATFELTV